MDKWDHHAYCGGSLTNWSGHVAIQRCSRTRRLHKCRRIAARRPTAFVVKKNQVLPGVVDLAAGPLDTVEKRCQRANKASGFGHTRAICEKDIIMQILPVS